MKSNSVFRISFFVLLATLASNSLVAQQNLEFYEWKDFQYVMRVDTMTSLMTRSNDHELSPWLPRKKFGWHIQDQNFFDLFFQHSRYPDRDYSIDFNKNIVLAIVLYDVVPWDLSVRSVQYYPRRHFLSLSYNGEPLYERGGGKTTTTMLIIIPQNSKMIKQGSRSLRFSVERTGSQPEFLLNEDGYEVFPLAYSISQWQAKNEYAKYNPHPTLKETQSTIEEIADKLPEEGTLAEGTPLEESSKPIDPNPAEEDVQLASNDESVQNDEIKESTQDASGAQEETNTSQSGGVSFEQPLFMDESKNDNVFTSAKEGETNSNAGMNNTSSVEVKSVEEETSSDPIIRDAYEEDLPANSERKEAVEIKKEPELEELSKENSNASNEDLEANAEASPKKNTVETSSDNVSSEQSSSLGKEEKQELDQIPEVSKEQPQPEKDIQESTDLPLNNTSIDELASQGSEKESQPAEMSEEVVQDEPVAKEPEEEANSAVEATGESVSLDFEDPLGYMVKPSLVMDPINYLVIKSKSEWDSFIKSVPPGMGAVTPVDQDKFEDQIALAVIKQGNTYWIMKTKSAKQAGDVLELNYTAEITHDNLGWDARVLYVTFVPKGTYSKISFYQNGHMVKTISK